MTELLAWLALLFGIAPASPDGRPEAAACMAVAYAVAASPSHPAPPPPGPKPDDDQCCAECKGTGVITHGDGHTTPCPCDDGCDCKKGRTATPREG